MNWAMSDWMNENDYTNEYMKNMKCMKNESRENLGSLRGNFETLLATWDASFSFSGAKASSCWPSVACGGAAWWVPGGLQSWSIHPDGHHWVRLMRHHHLKHRTFKISSDSMTWHWETMTMLGYICATSCKIRFVFSFPLLKKKKQISF